MLTDLKYRLKEIILKINLRKINYTSNELQDYDAEVVRHTYCYSLYWDNGQWNIESFTFTY